MKNILPVLFLIFSVIFFGCQKNDTNPPILTLNQSDTIFHILNAKYNDAGATATDEIDGNITSNIYVDNLVNENKIGEYTVTYHVIDKAGNEAKPLTRWVFVYNQGYIYSGYYSLKETNVYPENNICQYDVFINTDSAINYGLTFNSFACNFGIPVFAQVSDTVIVLPFQILDDSNASFNLQGNGYINDTLIHINYTLTKGNSIELWDASFERYK
jgi:hypothetical protein